MRELFGMPLWILKWQPMESNENTKYVYIDAKLSYAFNRYADMSNQWQDKSIRSLNTCGDVSKRVSNTPFLRNNYELDSILVNKGWIHGELSYFKGISSNLIKSDDKSR